MPRSKLIHVCAPLAFFLSKIPLMLLLPVAFLTLSMVHGQSSSHSDYGLGVVLDLFFLHLSSAAVISQVVLMFHGNVFQVQASSSFPPPLA